MASLLSQASSYEENDSTTLNNGENRTNRRNNGNKTIKKRPTSQYGVEPGKKKCIETLMQMTGADDDDDETGLVDFQPPAKPELTRVPMQEQEQEQQHNGLNIKYPNSNLIAGSMNNISNHISIGKGNNQTNSHLSQPSLYSNAYSVPPNLEANFQNAISNVQANINGQNQKYNYNQQTSNNGNINEQLNYIIHLLEEQQNTKTSTTTEELILYTFLGVFTIYIVDSFTKVSKSYTR